MCAQVEHFDDIKCEDAPPSYDAISVLSGLKDPVERRATALSLIHAIVSTTPPSFAPIDIATALPAAEVSDLLQTPDIEDHTAMYWAIVNNRREAFSTWAKFIPKFSSNCVSDLRLACMVTSDYGLFKELRLARSNIDSKDELRCLLGGPPDEIEVRELGNNKFIASVRISMFQKRMCIAKQVGDMEFVAGGRIWWLRFDTHGREGWRVAWGLSRDSFPAHIDAVLQIKAHRRKTRWNIIPGTLRSLRMNWNTPKNAFKFRTTNDYLLDDWLMDKDSKYLDCNGTLHADLEVKCK